MVNTRSKTKKIQKQASMDDQSGALIGSNDDLLTEILIRLPVTSILRFKSVSKHWRSLLSQRHFTNRYDKLSKSPGIFAGNSYFPFDLQNPTTPPFRTLDFYFDSRPIIILQSCNGLLLCRTDRPNSGQDQKYYVFNPTTKQLATIPSISGGKPARNTICCMGLAFHQTLCLHYKLVCIRALDRRRNLFQIQIYSSDTRKWKISIEFFCVDVANFRNGVYWNGALYWAPSYRNHMYFKIDDEQLQTLPLPAAMVSSNIVTRCFGESRGHLHLIVGNYRGDNSCLNVYEMLIDCSGWFVKYQVRLFQFYRAFPGMVQTLSYRFHVVDVVRGEEEEDTFMVLIIAGEMVIYNVHHNTFNQIFTLPNQFDRGYSGFRRYTETLGGF